MIADGHDCICDCKSPFGHLLASIFPPGHQDRFLSIEEIINRDIKECLSGGKEEESPGFSGGTDIKEEQHAERKGGPEEDIDTLLAAAAAAAEENTR